MKRKKLIKRHRLKIEVRKCRVKVRICWFERLKSETLRNDFVTQKSKSRVTTPSISLSTFCSYFYITRNKKKIQ